MRKGIKKFLEKLKFVRNYQRFLSKIGRILVRIGSLRLRSGQDCVMPPTGKQVSTNRG